jgi:hypothetical protein
VRSVTGQNPIYDKDNTLANHNMLPVWIVLAHNNGLCLLHYSFVTPDNIVCASAGKKLPPPITVIRHIALLTKALRDDDKLQFKASEASFRLITISGTKVVTIKCLAGRWPKNG